MSSIRLRVAFLGAGNMALALCRGLIERGVVDASDVTAASPTGAPRLAALGVTAFNNNTSAAAGADIVIIAVKPHLIETALAPLLIAGGGAASTSPLYISIASGKSISQISEMLRGTTGGNVAQHRVVRAMPNTPCSVGVGASAVCGAAPASDADIDTVVALFTAVGLVERVTEPQLDAVTGLSGSGPAFVFMFVEALADGGVAAGLPRASAARLAAQLVRGAAVLLQESGRHPGELKDAVASPGGTTIAGIHALERGGMRGIVMDAVVAASERCATLRNPKQ